MKKERQTTICMNLTDAQFRKEGLTSKEYSLYDSPFKKLKE